MHVHLYSRTTVTSCSYGAHNTSALTPGDRRDVSQYMGNKMCYPNTEWEENSYEAHLIGQRVIKQHES